MTQPIRLYPPGTPISTQPTDTTTPVIAESYDEIVFTNPTESFYQQLQSIATAPSCQQQLYSQHTHFPTYSDTQDCQAMLQAQKLLQEHLAQVKQNLIQLDHDLAHVEEALRVQQEEVRKKAARKAATATTAQSSKNSSASNSTQANHNKKAKTG